MNDRNLYAALNDQVLMVDVQFGQHASQRYTYKAHVEHGISVGNHVVVPVRREEDKYEFVVAKVVKVHDRKNFKKDINYSWIVNRVDTGLYEQMREREAEFDQAVLDMERDEQRNLLKERLKTRLGAKGATKLLSSLK